MSLIAFFDNIVKTVAAIVSPPKPNVSITVQPTRAEAPAQTRPVIVPVAPPAPKIESTAVTYGQQYQIQQANADGTLTLRTIPLSELQENDQNFDPRLTELTNTVRKQQASLLQGLRLPPQALQAALVAGLKVNFAMTIKSRESAPLEINLLQTPEMTARLQYNYYTPVEGLLSIQEDLEAEAFAKPGATDKTVPMFVNLSWQPVDTLYLCNDFDPKTQEEQAIVNQYLKPVRGVSNGTAVDQSKLQALLRKTNTLSRGGVALELVDTHDLPTAFESISNGKIFKDSALAVMNTKISDVNKIEFDDILTEGL